MIIAHIDIVKAKKLKPIGTIIYENRTKSISMKIFCPLKKLFTLSINLCQIYYFALIRFIIYLDILSKYF
jgi:hypothetical protein